MKVDEIKDSLARDVREPWLHVCHQVVDEMARRRPVELFRLTYMMIAGFVGRSAEDEILQSAITTLTTHRHHPLTMYYVFLDVADDREIAISSSDVMQSVDENVFIHPRTGEEVPDFADLIRPVFKASGEFLDGIRRNG